MRHLWAKRKLAADLVSTCRVCDAKGDHPRYVAREMMYGTREEFIYFKCMDCGCLQIAHIPEDMGKYYPADYYSYEKNDNTLRSVLYTFFQRERCRTALFGRRVKLDRLLRRFVEFPPELHEWAEVLLRANLTNFDDAVLDVGCGNSSRWLGCLAQVGFTNLRGIDPFANARSVNNLYSVEKKTLAEVRGTFALITFHHSFEHLADPVSILSRVRELLGREGTCLFRIPILGASWKKYGVDWVELDAPRHFFLHSEGSFRRLMDSAGMEIVHTFYDTTEFELIGSEQYRRGIPLLSDSSYFVSKMPSSA